MTEQNNSFDIYNFINSKDIADYCRSIDHKFTPLEMAVLIHLSREARTARHTAYNWLIENTPDCEVPERMNCAYHESLHEYLIEIMRFENNDLIADSDKMINIDLEGIFISIPVPFKNGDLVKTKNDDDVYVIFGVDWLNKHAKKERLLNYSMDITDMTINGYHMGKDNFWYEHLLVLDIEYYEGELTEYNRFLKILSLYIKGKLGGCEIWTLLNAYDAVKNNKPDEYIIKNIFPGFGSS